MLQSKSFRRRVAEIAYPLVPPILKRKLHERLKSFYMTDIELKEIMEGSRFAHYEMSRHVCTSPLWKGAHFECIAIKDKDTSPNVN